jgi:TM2 domain-containing membrane protein YozV
VDAVAKEQWALALLTAHFDCAQQKFFQGEYGRRRRSPALALALCLTLGAFGAHEFYMGRLVSATLRLLFCWTLIPLILALIEASFLTQRVYGYNRRMAHTLAEIVDETFAAAREEAREEASWRVGAARTLAPQPPTRWSQGTPPTTPLAEERQAPDAVDPTPSAALTARGEQSARAGFPLALQERGSGGEVTHSVSRPFGASRREWARLSPSLDALLEDLTARAGEAGDQRSSLPATPTSVLSDPRDTSAPAAPVAPRAAAPSAYDAPSMSDATPAEDYAKMMAPDEPLAAIMSAESASDAVAVAVPAPAPRIQRIIVRKVALLDGQRIAEARATRDVVLSGADEYADAARIEAATDDARVEAERLLATLVTPEALTQARAS